MTQQPSPTLDLDTVRAWMKLWANSPGLIHICSTGNWTGRAFPATDSDAATAYVAQLDGEGREGIYARITTLRGQLPAGSRGSEEDSLALPAIAVDLDIAGPGHKTTHTLPPDEDAARKIITESGLPTPTLLVHSGGGLYPFWLLNQAHPIDGDLDDLRAFTRQWEQVIAATSTRLGWHFGTGVRDLARVLRIPGTVNRKAGLVRPCQVIDTSGPRYTLNQLRTSLAQALSAITEPAPASDPSPFTAPAKPTPPPGFVRPGDDYEQRVDWAEILEPHGWRLDHTAAGVRYWRRPDKDRDHSATTGHANDRDRLFVFSTETPFTAWTPYTKFKAYSILNHNGDDKTAAAALAAAGYGTRPAAAATFATGPTAVPPPGLLAPPGALEPPAPRGFATTLLRRSQLRGLPPVEPLIHSVLSLRVSAVLVGATGLGKTFVALSWACSVATGHDWLGNDVERVKTLYVVGEGASGLDSRVTAWEQSWHTKVDDEDLIFSVKPDSLANPQTWAEMQQQARDLEARFIILDTFSSLAPDADETKDAATITRRLSDLSAAIDGTSLLIHHPGWGDSGRTRGGYQLEANVDEVLVLTGESDSDLIELTRKKVKEGAAGQSQWLRRKPVFDSVIIESASANDAEMPLRDRVLRLLANTGAHMSVPQIQTELEIKHRGSLWKAIQRLVSQQKVREHGTGDRKTYSASPNAGMFTAPGGTK